MPFSLSSRPRHRAARSPQRTAFAAVAVLAVTAGGAVVGLAPASAAPETVPVTDFAALQEAVGPSCEDGDVVRIDAAMSGGVLTTSCTVTIDLNRQTVSTAQVAIESGTILTVTDLSEAGTAGSLTANGTNSHRAGIRTTGAALVVGGRASVSASGGREAAGIGGDYLAAGGSTTINDRAVVTANGGIAAAGIGGGASSIGGSSGDGGTTAISGNAVVTATGGDSAGAGIGGGVGGAGGTTTITGTARVTATGDDGGAGIGGGRSGGDGGSGTNGAGTGGVTTISDGVTVTATGGSDGAGIGGGSGASGVTTLISGTASVTAVSSDGGSGIGSGSGVFGGAGSVDGGTTAISGGATVAARGGSRAAGIGGGTIGNGGTFTAVGTARIAAVGGRFAAGVGGGINGAGATVTVSGSAVVTATGGQGGAAVGGGTFGTGGTTTVSGEPGGGARLNVTPGPGNLTAVGAGESRTATGPLLIQHGVLNVVSGDLRVVRATGDDPEVTIGEGGLIESRARNSQGQDVAGSGRLTSLAVNGAEGRIRNGGAITLPSTSIVDPLVITDHDYLVAFDSNTDDSAVSPAPSPVEVLAPSFDAGKRDFPAAPTRPGYTFRGWTTAPGDGGEPVTASSELPGASGGTAPLPVTAYAQWRRNGSTADPVVVTTYDQLAAAVAGPCSEVFVRIGGTITASDASLDTACDTTINLAGSTVTLRTVTVADATTLTVTDGESSVAPGSLNTSARVAEAGIDTTGATLAVAGRAQVSAQGGVAAAGIGGDAQQAGGETTVVDDAVVTASSPNGGAGIGGGFEGGGGTTTIADDATVTANGGTGAAGIGGGFGGGGGTTTIADDATVTANGGTGAAGIGGGINGAGGVVVIDGDGGLARVAATPRNTASAIGPGAGSTVFGSLSVDDAVLDVGTGALRVDRGAEPGPEVTVGEGGIIESSTETGGIVSDGSGEQAGRIDNGGAITIPTNRVRGVAVLDRHHKVTFDPNGSGAQLAPGTEPVVVLARSFEDGERAFPADPTRRGYTFTGWVSTPDGEAGGVPVTATSELPGTSIDGQPVAITAYAQWTRNPSPPQPPVDPEPPVEEPLPAVRASVGGQPKVGERLTASATLDGDVEDASYAYQWLRDGSPIAGADSRSYRPRRADIGREVSVEVTASAPGRTSSSDVSRSVAVGPVVGIVGVTRVGRELTPRVVVPEGARATYRWETSERPARGQQRVWEQVSTADSYTLRGRDAGQRVRLIVTISGSGFSTVTSYSPGRYVRR